MPRLSRRWSYEARLLAGTLLVAAPALIALAALFAVERIAIDAALVIWAVVAVVTLSLAFAVRNRAIYPLNTLANLLEALREGDYSLRGSRAQQGDAIGEVIIEINALADTLREQRLSFEEKGALLAKVIAALDIAVIAFDDTARLKLANPAAERLLGTPFDGLEGSTANELDLADWLGVRDARLFERAFPGASGRWEVRGAHFREGGRPHDLLVITDLSRTLREEERLAWQRLLRVLGHELNNSLAPIRSMAAMLAKLVAVEPPPHDWRDDASQALAIIGDRAEALARFMTSYTTLARLPAPTVAPADVALMIRRVAQLEQRIVVEVGDGPSIEVSIDADQIEQALINLVKNAAEASLTTGGGVRIDWREERDVLAIDIADDGAGLPPSENLFVPFFTTKRGGSGVGLVLARQIAEGHGGSLTLENRVGARGCIARMRLPSAAKLEANVSRSKAVTGA